MFNIFVKVAACIKQEIGNEKKNSNAKLFVYVL